MIYLDYHATTPCDPLVVEAMLPFFTKEFANPSSATHLAGRSAAKVVEQARRQVAELVGANPKEIIFTSGATESNNLAILGMAQRTGSHRRKIVTTSIEHKSVLAPCKYLEKFGYEVVVLPVDSVGQVNHVAAREAIDRNTFIVSIQSANNEIGTIQDIPFFEELAHEHGAIFHTDAAQAVGKIPVDVVEWGIDLLSISAHKLYGPKGVGALFIRGGPFSMPITPLVFGGGQENDIRPGTLNVPGIVGLGKACELCREMMSKEATQVAEMRNQLEIYLLNKFPSAHLNGDTRNRLPGNCSLTFPGFDAEVLIANVPELSLSTGSACTSGAPSPSHVLLAIGLSREEAYKTIRIGIGRYSTGEEMTLASNFIIAAAGRIQGLSL